VAASGRAVLRIKRYRGVRVVLQNHAWLNVQCSVSKGFNACCRGRSPGLSHSLRTAGLTRRSSGRPTAGHVRLSSYRPCRRWSPLTSNVRPPRRLTRERHVLARQASTKRVVATFASGRPSAGGQRTIALSHRALSQHSAPAPESRMAQRSVQRLKGLQRLWPRSLAGVSTFAPHRRPNPSVKRTPNSRPRSAVFGAAVPLLVAPYLKR